MNRYLELIKHKELMSCQNKVDYIYIEESVYLGGTDFHNVRLHFSFEDGDDSIEKLSSLIQIPFEEIVYYEENLCEEEYSKMNIHSLLEKYLNNKDFKIAKYSEVFDELNLDMDFILSSLEFKYYFSFSDETLYIW